MAGLEKLAGAVCILIASALVVSCRDANVPVSDTGSNGEARTTSPLQLSVGDPAPDFSLPGSDGKVYSLASYRGKQSVVLAWFVKAFTGP
jgi:cytochrome oxidase Cu insertion factor (SCO1/SenC/PrrC family)